MKTIEDSLVCILLQATKETRSSSKRYQLHLLHWEKELTNREDAIDIILRKGFLVWLAKEKQENPQLFLFLKKDVRLWRALEAKPKEREGMSMKGVSSNNMPRPSKEKIQELKGCEVKLVM